MGWLSGWQYRKSHEIEGSTAGAQTDYQIRIRVHYGSGTDSGEDVYLNEKCRSDFGDVRFTKDDGETLLSYWMEEEVDGDYAIFWVKVPSIPASPDSATIYVYYGKSDATYAGDGEDAFLLFDDFEGSELDTSKWNTHLGSGGSISVSDGQLVMQEGSGSGDAATWTTVYSKQTFDNIAVKARIKFTAMEDILLRMGAADEQFYVFRLDGRSGKYDLIGKYPAGAAHTTELVTGSGSSPDTWYKHEARAYGSQLRQYKDAAEELSTTDSDFTSGYIGVSTDGASGTVYVDWILVRKYADPEPSHGSWGSEEQPPPTVSTQSASDISTTTAVLNGSVDAINDSEIVERGFEWGAEPGNYPNSWTEAGSFGAGSFSHQITGLSPGTTYYFRAKAKNNLGKWGYGDEVSFTTLTLQEAITVPSGHGCIYYPRSGSLDLDLSWAKWLRLYLYGDHVEDFPIKIRLYTTENDYFEASIMVKAGEWRKYEVSMDSLSEVGSPSLSNINLIAIHSPYPLLIDSDHVFLPAVRELMRAKFTLKRGSPDDPSPKLKLVKLIWREGA